MSVSRSDMHKCELTNVNYVGMYRACGKMKRKIFHRKNDDAKKVRTNKTHKKQPIMEKLYCLNHTVQTNNNNL